jgi:hypothetical protein
VPGCKDEVIIFKCYTVNDANNEYRPNKIMKFGKIGEKLSEEEIYDKIYDGLVSKYWHI